MNATSSPSSQALQSVLFDWGGVLIENPVDGILRFARKHVSGLSERALQGDAMIAFQKGELEEREFWHRLGASTTLDLAKFGGSLWRAAFESTYTERKVVLGIAARLQQEGIGTAVLSNTEIPAVEMLMQRGYTCFDTYCFSCEWGMVKPDPEIYERCLRTLAVPARSILFIDDKVENIAAAEATGMRGHLMRDVEGLRACLRQWGLPHAAN